MEFVGRKVKKLFHGDGAFSGVVKAFEPGTGLFKIVYEDGDSVELGLMELHLVLEQPTRVQQAVEFRVPGLGRNPEKQPVDCNDSGQGKINENSVFGYGVCGNLVDVGGCSKEFGLNLNEGIDLNEIGFSKLNADDHGGNEVGGRSKLHGLDLNEVVDLEVDEGLDLNKDVDFEESSVVKKEMIDLNLDVNENLENSSKGEEKRGFDLNLESAEDDVMIIDERGGKFGENERVYSVGDVQMREKFVEDKKLLVKEDADNLFVLSKENKEENPFRNWATKMDNENLVTPVSSMRRKGGRRRKDALSHNVALPATEAMKVDLGVGYPLLNALINNVAVTATEAMDVDFGVGLESRDGTPGNKYSESVGNFNESSSSLLRGRRGRKQKELLDDNVNLATPESGLRRSSRRAKMAAASSSGQHHVLSAARLNETNRPLYSPTTSTVSDYKVMVAAHEKPVLLPPKVELPPSSSNLDLDGVSVFDFVYVYSLLRSFSSLLFLSPFELEEFVGSVRCNDSTLLFDSIHVALLSTLRKQLEFLSKEGSNTASKCLRSLNWDFLDLITWPMFVVEYLLLHSPPKYIPGVDLRQMNPFQRNFYKLPVSAKVEILRHLCDDVIQTEAFRSEINRRTLATETRMEVELNKKFDSSRKRKAVMDIASYSCVTQDDNGEPEDGNSDECALCKMDGNLICCDGCPAAFHSRCVGVVSNLLPEGDWYCPECMIEKDRPWMKLKNSIRGANLLGNDPYGRSYHSSSGYLLVSESCDDGNFLCWYYHRNDVPILIEALESVPFIYDTLICVIRKDLNIVHGVGGTRNDLDTRSYSMQSAFPSSTRLHDMHPTPSKAPKITAALAEKSSHEKSMVAAYSWILESESGKHVTVAMETDNHGVKVENQVVSSEGSAEVSQAFTKTDTLKESGLETGTDIPDDTQVPVSSGDHNITSTPLGVEGRDNLNPENCSCSPSGVKSRNFSTQVHYRTNYSNCYEFARAASSILEQFTRKLSDKISEDTPRSVEEILAKQVKVVSNRFANFSWSNILDSTLNYKKEKCGWCVYCKVPEEEMDCLFIMNNSIPAIEKFTSEALGIEFRNKRENHLIDIMCHMICIEDHLQGLLSGPWSDPDYSMLWRKSVVEVAGIASLKSLLLELEANLHPLALSADWRKHVESAAPVGSASHIVNNSARTYLRKASDYGLIEGPIKNAFPGLSTFWWRGGKDSRKLFNCKVLPRSMASKAARQAGLNKIPGIYYLESGEYAKRTKYTAWRAAVETSRSVEQLALQIRELDANIKWDNIGISNLQLMMEKHTKKSVKSFNKVTVRKKCSEGPVVKYLLDFGKKRFIPDVVVRLGSVLEESSNSRKKYWLEESHVPLHLLKAFEEKRIARKSNKTSSGNHLEQSGVVKPPVKKKGFEYLFLKAERLEYYQCVHCQKDVLVREAVSCQYCKGFFHKRHVRKASGSVTAECTYTCHKCHSKELAKIVAKKRKLQVAKLNNISKGLKQLRSGKGKKAGKVKQPVNSDNKKIVPPVVPIRRSARVVARISRLALQNNAVKKRKRGRPAKSGKAKLINTNNSWGKTKKRTHVLGSFWLKGLQFLLKPNDEQLEEFRSKELLVLSGASATDTPKCILCGELEYASELNYVACQNCKAWFHGDALDLSTDKIEKLVGFKCYMCLNKKPPVCPFHPSGSNNTKLVSENYVEIGQAFDGMSIES